MKVSPLIWRIRSGRSFCGIDGSKRWDVYGVCAQDATYTMNYHLHLLDKEWRVYDVVIKGISVVNNYRSQFSRIVTRASYEDLVRRMKEKRVLRQN